MAQRGRNGGMMSKAIEAINEEIKELEKQIASRKKALAALGEDLDAPVSYVPTAKASKKPARKVQPRKQRNTPANKRVRKPARKMTAKPTEAELNHAMNMMRDEAPMSMGELAASGVESDTIAALVADGKVIKTGAKRGTKYQLAPEAKAAE